jgi:putative transcriptional regulator
MNAKLISTQSKKSKTTKGRTDWKKVKAMTEKKIVKAAKSDPDAKPLSAARLKKFKRVHPPKVVDVKGIREKLRLSQAKFAGYFGVSTRTVQEWEQHRREPTATARNFLKVIEREPEAVLRALSSNR